MTVLDSFRLDGRVAVVTGGNRGLGEVFARALRDAGARVAIAARDQERSESVARELGATAVTTDVTDPASVAAMLAAVTAELGPVDVLVNNAGVCFHGAALEVPDEEWRAVWDVNVDGLWHCSRAVGAQMVERGAGVIVNIGSLSAMIVNRPQMQPAYNASKAAVHHLTRSLAAEWAPFGVRVNALAPGYVKTEMAPVDEPQFRRHWIEDTPMRRYALPEELGPSLVYLASDASSFMTGSVLVVDGGYSVY
jgi:NAD(P)-dependent dehydrogenase (short-subunit alcohol dehydrogenase family)